MCKKHEDCSPMNFLLIKSKHVTKNCTMGYIRINDMNEASRSWEALHPLETYVILFEAYLGLFWLIWPIRLILVHWGPSALFQAYFSQIWHIPESSEAYFRPIYGDQRLIFCILKGPYLGGGLVQGYQRLILSLSRRLWGPSREFKVL